MLATEQQTGRAIALTGGIGSGKSTVAELFREHGVAIIDADEVAHAISQPGQLGALTVEATFGADYLDANGAINRRKLRQAVFGNVAAREKLEQALHPLIYKEMLLRLRAVPAAVPYSLLVVPLLFESADKAAAGGKHYLPLVEKVIVVDCTEAAQMARVLARGQESKLTEQDVRAIMHSQLSRAARLARADVVIENHGNLADLAAQVARLHQTLLQPHYPYT